ncbi:MAG: formyltransferase [Clostridia bacterium]
MGQSRAARAVVFGYGDIGVRCLGALLDAGVEVPLVVTHRDDPKESRWYASLADFAKARRLRVLLDPMPGPLEQEVENIHPDLLFSFYYRSMLPVSLLRHAKKGAFNLHGSLLPKYRGRAPLNWAILHGEKETGVTLHEMVEKPDAGGIVDQQAVSIGPDETAVEVFRKMTEAAVAVLRRSLNDLIEGKAKLRPNDLSKGSYFGRRTPQDGRIDWSRGAAEIHNLVRAVAPPFPGAFCDLQGNSLWINKTRIEPAMKAPAGQQGPFRQGDEWFAACGDGKVLRLLDVEKK